MFDFDHGCLGRWLSARLSVTAVSSYIIVTHELVWSGIGLSLLSKLKLEGWVIDYDHWKAWFRLVYIRKVLHISLLHFAEYMIVIYSNAGSLLPKVFGCFCGLFIVFNCN